MTLTLQCSPAIARPAQTYTLSIPSVPPDARLMGFSITVKAGRIVRLLDCPPGWTITLENDPAWQATIEGHAIVGAASIPAGKLPSLLLLESIPRTVADVVTGPIAAAGKLTIMRNGELTVLDTPRMEVLLFRKDRHRS